VARNELTIVLPGLARIVGQEINANSVPPVLAKIIKKARFDADVTSLARILFNHFSQTPLTVTDLPVVSLMSPSLPAIKADPCYLHPDRDRLLVFADNLDITEQESTALIAEIQPLLEEFNGQLLSLQSDSWLLTLADMPKLSFTALPEVNGKAVDTHLPQGADQRSWIRLWNEIQMQLYNADINQQRIAAGKLPINSVWFWGVGRFIAQKNAWLSVQGTGQLLSQLAEQSGVKLNQNSDWSGSLPSLLNSGKHLWVLDELDLEADWQQKLQQFNDTNLQLLWQQLQRRKMSKITLQIPEYGQYVLTPFDVWKFWK
tara:strand:+ start:37212 stop:38159 length:948 start_codon:yes stop_codon:yes gene_type:complete